MRGFRAVQTVTGKFKAQAQDGGQCLHLHRTTAAAQRCAAQLNKPTPQPGTPRGAYDYAAGYHD